MRLFNSWIASPLVAAVALAHPIPASAQDTGLPGGATTLSEAHGAWSVTCAVRNQTDETITKVCALSQQQLSQQTRQRALAIELRPEDGGAQGVLVLPFGLALEKGVAYRLDDGQTGSPQTFRTCLPAGCLIDINFDASIVAGLKAGNTLNLIATADGGQEMVFSISLDGFSSAFDRVTALMD
ncbi:invasion associated locus B family protein [Pelagibacterium halotolerans]|uniref:invasion associated locus B family protein n=1 Tax=Pelagibacterium halotolerans TaxID=531813 RepID=UPI00384B70ED